MLARFQRARPVEVRMPRCSSRRASEQKLWTSSAYQANISRTMAASAAVLHGSVGRTHSPLPRSGSCDADGLRASQLQHAVQRMNGNVHLGRPTLVRAGAQPIANHLLEPAHGGLDPGANIVSGGLLPSHAAML